MFVIPNISYTNWANIISDNALATTRTRGRTDMILNMRHRLSVIVIGHKYPNVWVMEWLGIIRMYKNICYYLERYIPDVLDGADCKLWIYVTLLKRLGPLHLLSAFPLIIFFLFVCLFDCLFVFKINDRQYITKLTAFRIKPTSFHYHCRYAYRGTNELYQPICMNLQIKLLWLQSSGHFY